MSLPFGWIRIARDVVQSHGGSNDELVDLFELTGEVDRGVQIDRPWARETGLVQAGRDGVLAAVDDGLNLSSSIVTERRRFDCQCRRQDPPWIAKVIESDRHGMWAVVNRERVTVGGQVRRTQPAAWPLTADENRAARVEVVTCRRCPRSWAVLFDGTEVLLLATGQIRRGVLASEVPDDRSTGVYSDGHK